LSAWTKTSTHQLPAVISAEAIVVVDVVESTLANNTFGWYAVGRSLLLDLKNTIVQIGMNHQLSCLKSTGDGYLLAYADTSAAELGCVHAVEAAFELVESLKRRNENSSIPEERRINVRITIHFGQVDVIENDREGRMFHTPSDWRASTANRSERPSVL
jgi:class 3 adenylate cyclase